MTRRQTVEARFKIKLGGGITAYREASGTLENAQLMAAHESPGTTKLPGRGGDTCAASVIGVPARGPNSQIQAMPTARKPGWHGEWLQTATRCPGAPPANVRGHSTPIALATGERFSPTRFSLTGAHSSRRIHPQRTVRRAAKRKTLYVIIGEKDLTDAPVWGCDASIDLLID